ncbi:MAG: type II toxin-antitoxin system Phd/YefM family antitoxin [Verrucomicrobiales bacterium]
MITESKKPKTISISEFKAHCTEQLRAVQEEGITLEITRHGKVIAVARPPEPGHSPANLLGAGKDSAHLTDSYDPHAPAFEEDDWEMNKD